MTLDVSGLDWLERWAHYSPQAVAIECADTGKIYSYEKAYQLSVVLAEHLQEKYQLKVGDRVAVLATNEIEYWLLFLVLQRLGVIAVPVNYRLTVREINHILMDSEPRLLVYQEAYAGIVEELAPSSRPEYFLRFDGADGWTEQVEKTSTSKSESFFYGEFDSPCMILYTSGTTGSPKGAIITNKMLFWNSLNTSLSLDLTSQDRTVTFAPFFHTGGWNVLTTPFLHRGAKVILLKKFAPEKVLELCVQHQVTILFGVPTTMEMMARTDLFHTADLSSMRYAVVGGEPMTAKAIEVWGQKGIPVRQGYGLTEFGPNNFSLHQRDAIRKIGSIGFPNFYVEARVVDNEGREMKANEVGELVLRGPACMAGYWRNEEATRQTILDGWLHTGDLVRRDPEGYYYVVGRKKEMYISGGENVYPVEVEKVIHALKGVREVAVIGVPDEKWGEAGRAFVVKEPESDVDEKGIVEHCLKNLAKYKIPKHIQFVPELPKGDSGKILKRRLSELSL